MGRTHLSLFSGIGGLDLAAEWAGFRTVAFVEFDPYCQKVLKRHWPEVPIYGDVREFDGREFRGVSVLSAGFPCQPHSLAGKREASGDERDLWGEVVRVVGEARPRFFVGENVPGLLSSECGAFFGRVLDDLAKLGYRVGWGLWRASDVGAVHLRRRIFIVASDSEGEQDWRVFESGLESDFGAKGVVDASDSSGVRREGLSTGELGSSEEEGRVSESVSRDAGDSCGFDSESRRATGNVAGSAEDAEGKAQERERGGGAAFYPVSGGDWRAWDVEPIIRRADDGLSYELDKCRLKALGNAVCPQQAFPLFEAIAGVLE